ncbi:DUF4258 domain-containing protein [Elstera sp.]|uniref:DUF4258 domain-containing protein n=1 Tax=Elstera sp. TaxID=1916664 RepID=UPI0037C0C567
MLRLSAHAQTVIEARCIEEAWISETLAHPDWTESDPRDRDIIRAFKRIEGFGGRILRVAYKPVGSDILIVTAFFDRGARQ